MMILSYLIPILVVLIVLKLLALPFKIIKTVLINSIIGGIILFLLSFFGIEVGDNIVHAVFYTVLNIPLIIFSFLKIGKKFTIFTTVNVVASTLFIWLLSKEGGVAEYFASIQIAADKPMIDSILGRILFGAICTGVCWWHFLWWY